MEHEEVIAKLFVESDSSLGQLRIVGLNRSAVVAEFRITVVASEDAAIRAECVANVGFDGGVFRIGDSRFSITALSG